jgi:hypothetical protein
MAENIKATLNEALNGKDKVSPSSKKLEDAKAFIAKHGLPEGWDNDNSIYVSGVLEEVNANKNTFVISVHSPNEKTNKKYLVSIIAETLNELVKNIGVTF